MKKEIINEQIIKDIEEIIRLRRITIPNNLDMDSIYFLYKKYIDKNAGAPIRTCNSCGQSIQNYYWKTIGLPSNYEQLKNMIK